MTLSSSPPSITVYTPETAGCFLMASFVASFRSSSTSININDLVIPVRSRPLHCLICICYSIYQSKGNCSLCSIALSFGSVVKHTTTFYRGGERIVKNLLKYDTKIIQLKPFVLIRLVAL